jgi:hypothetical protein
MSRKPPEEVVNAWCPKCGFLDGVERPSRKGCLVEHCTNCLGDVESVLVRYQLRGPPKR